MSSEMMPTRIYEPGEVKLSAQQIRGIMGIGKGFFGKLIFSYEDGEVTRIVKEESIKL